MIFICCFILDDLYSRAPSGPGASSGPPTMPPSGPNATNSKPPSDYGAYGGPYGTYYNSNLKYLN